MNLLQRQPLFPELCPIIAAIDTLAHSGGIEERGAIFTRREVVDFILDLVGYTSDRSLHELRLLEPACGTGDFLLPAIGRLLAAWTQAGDRTNPLQELGDCIRAVELHRSTFEQTRVSVITCLVDHGIDAATATALAQRWLLQDDFLLAEIPDRFDVVIGNPPYVRQEMIPGVLLAEYRRRYATIYDRADLYVPFIERSLALLTQGGALGFICADRWMKNQYGGPLRALVAREFHLKIYVDMTDTPAFHSDVVAYPAITVMTRAPQSATRIAYRPAIDRASLRTLADQLTAPVIPASSMAVHELTGITNNAEPWVLTSSGTLALVRRLEGAFPTLEAAGCKVGIGVATGADQAFIGLFDALDVEVDRKERLVMTRDITGGHVAWRGHGVVNPFAEGGGLVDLEEYPRLKRFLQARKSAIAGRHCAKKNPANWYRTIDRITPSLTPTPKLLIPDIKGDAQIVFDEGHFYPHHNLYYITAEQWDLRALQAVLLSGIARLFVATYATRMRGGYLRFQAQYLRRIRVPHWSNVPMHLRQQLISAAQSGDLAASNQAACELYRLTDDEQAVMQDGHDA